MLLQQIRDYIISPTLSKMSSGEIDLATPAAINLLVGTCAQETAGGAYIRQIGYPIGSLSGAYGIYQCELRSADMNLRSARQKTMSKNARLASIFTHIVDFMGIPKRDTDLAAALMGDLYFATAMCRLHYMLVPVPIPEASDIRGLGEYWKKYYNTSLGRGTVDDFVENYRRYVDAQA